MLTAEIRVNGMLIKHIYIQNKGVTPGFNDIYQYYYEVTNVGEGKEGIKTGFVSHSRSKGAFVLIDKVLKEIVDEK